MANKTVTLADINAFCYDWLSTASDIAQASIGFKPQNWVMANQNAPAPQLPYGTWYVKELINVGHKDAYQLGYDDGNGNIQIDNLSFFQFSVEVTSLGYGSNALMTILSQYFDTMQFAFDSQVAGIGYQTHDTSRDISAVADAEVREARQFTVTFNCVMKLSEIAKAINQVQISTDLDPEAGVMYVPQHFEVVNGTGLKVITADGSQVVKG